MELELARLDNLESSSDEDEEDARAGPQVKKGGAKEDARAGPQVKEGGAKEDAQASPQVQEGAAEDDTNVGKTKDSDARREGGDLNSNQKQQSAKRRRQTVCQVYCIGLADIDCMYMYSSRLQTRYPRRE